jgi:hypothetical protein
MWRWGQEMSVRLRARDFKVWMTERFGVNSAELEKQKTPGLPDHGQAHSLSPCNQSVL